MNLRKLAITFAIFSFMLLQNSTVNAESDSAIRGIISKYKAGNYLGCINDSNAVIDSNPSSIIAYYYKGLAYTQLGKSNEASVAFDQVITLNSNTTLVEYAKRANACISNPQDCEKYQREVNDLDKFIRSKKFYSESVQSQVNQKKLDRIRENINDDINKREKKTQEPSNEEIANAVKTLAKVGINPLAGVNNAYTNPQMMQMSMLLGDNTYNNNNMNMLPMLLMNQSSNQQLSPELIQTMMMNQMSPAL